MLCERNSLSGRAEGKFLASVARGTLLHQIAISTTKQQNLDAKNFFTFDIFKYLSSEKLYSFLSFRLILFLLASRSSMMLRNVFVIVLLRRIQKAFRGLSIRHIDASLFADCVYARTELNISKRGKWSSAKNSLISQSNFHHLQIQMFFASK